jgi:hypothetical protein
MWINGAGNHRQLQAGVFTWLETTQIFFFQGLAPAFLLL